MQRKSQRSFLHTLILLHCEVSTVEILKELNGVSEYIENHITDDINISELAKITMQNSDGFLRLFTCIVGMTVNEYIRRRRLTLAVYDLQNSNEKVIDIAVKYGWNSCDAFRKAFFAQHGATPSKARDKSTPVKIFPPVHFEINVKGATNMNCKIVETKDLELYGITEVFGGTAGERFEQENIMWAADCRHIPEKICNGYDGVWYGIWNNGKYSIARAKEDTDFDNLERIVLKGGKYAVFTTEKGGYAGTELPKMHDLIFNSFLPNSKYNVKDDYIVEILHLATDKAERRKNRYYEICIPID